MRRESTVAGTRGDGHGTDPGTRARAAVVAVALPGLWRFLVERRREPSDLTGYFVSAAAAVTLVSGAAARISGDWRGWHTVLGTVSAGMGVACWLLFVRIALWGLPQGDPD